MNQDQSKIGLSSTLLAIIQANQDQHDLQEIAGRIFEHMEILDELRTKDPSKHAILTVVYTLMDNLMEKTAKEQKLSCRKGCAFCCKMNVDVSSLEVGLIIDYCQQNDIAIDQEYLKLQSDIEKHELGFTPNLSSCVFLSNENTCKIYPVRPMACRKYVVVTPAEQCNMIDYPNARIGVFVDLNAEILASAVDSLQNGEVDSLSKVLLKELSQSH